MHDACEQPVNSVAFIVAVLLAPLLCTACQNRPDTSKPSRQESTLRLGLSNAPSQSADRGIQQFVSNISNEGLLRVNQQGRLEPWLADRWQRSADGMHLTVTLRNGVRFHDGSSVSADAVADILRNNLPKTLRSAYDDVESIHAGDQRNIEFQFKRPSSFVADSFIDVPIQKGTGGAGTGPFMPKAVPGSGTAEMVAFDDYYLGRPNIDRITIKPYPNVRAAWADMLRDQLDMLYEVGADAMDMMRGATNATLYTFDRPFQYLILLNPAVSSLKSSTVRQGLNQAIDRSGIVKEGLGGHGTPSVGPVSPHHWAFQSVGKTFTYDPHLAASKFSKPFRIKCLTLPEPPFEQLALVVKQQLKAVGVDVDIEELPGEQITATFAKRNFEAILLDPASGWSLLRAYRWWHSQGPQNVTGFSNASVDSTLDRVRHAVNDDEYRAAVAAFEQAIDEDPPAIFLAWGERSRAVSRRFDVPAEPRRDVLATLRLWHPSADYRKATTN